MSDLGDLLNRQLDCAPNDDACFAHANTAVTNPSATIEEPTCEDWDNGFTCDTVNFIGKMNWMWNAITYAHDALDTRVDVLEGTVRLVDMVYDLNANTVTEVYSDGSQQVTSLEKFAENLTHISESSLNPAVPGRPTYAELQAFITANNLDSQTVYYTGDDTANPANAIRVIEVDQNLNAVEITEDDTVVFASLADVGAADAANPTFAEISAYVTANNLREVTVYYNGTNTANADARSYVWRVGSMGNVVNIEVPRATLPVAALAVESTSDSSNIAIRFTGESHPDCANPGITFSTVNVFDSNNVIVGATVGTPNPSFPLDLTFDVSASTGPFRVEHTVTDSCGTSTVVYDYFTVTASTAANLPAAQVLVTNSGDEAAVRIDLDGLSHPDCANPGITSDNYVIRDVNDVIISNVTTPNPTLPREIVVDVSGSTGPFVISYTVTDACGTGGESGSAIPARDAFQIGTLQPDPTVCFNILDVNGANRQTADLNLGNLYIDASVGGAHTSGPFANVGALQAQLTANNGGVTVIIQDDGSGNAQACFDGSDPAATIVGPIPTSFEQLLTFTHTGGTQTANAPSWASTAFVEAWGAGGGGGATIAPITAACDGAAGGFASGTIPAGNFVVVVGGGGERAGGGTPQGGFGGGGDGGDGVPGGAPGQVGQGNSNNGGAGGGGYSGIFLNSLTFGNARIIAGGGGGGGTGSAITTAARAGNGGGNTGESSFHSPTLNSAPPTGGTQSSGGLGQIQALGGVSNGGNGAALQGGKGGEGQATGGSGGGGGGGYYGGGGGGGDNDPNGSSTTDRDTGGGGGSNYKHGSVTGGNNQRGNNLSAIGTGSPNYINPLGDGGNEGVNGQNGLVVINWQE